MSEFIIAAGSAFGFGILTSISPCPMAMNITAISYVSRRLGNARQVFLSALLYMAGQTLAYLGLAFVLIAGARSTPLIALFLQKYMHLILGPILIVAGMFLLQLIHLNMTGRDMGEGLQKRVDAMGVWGAFLLGAVFALTFCPTSASYYFGSLIPLSLKVNSSTILPIMFGFGAALPVMLFAVLLAISVQSVGKAYNILGKVERWARNITGWIFISLGVYFSLKYIFEVL
jgi:cytochrome c biogenesis protein CcdA